MKHTAITTLLVVAASALSGCADEFDPYEDVTEPRLLAIAADAPDLVPGATAEITPLLTGPATAFRWSWCPLVGSPNDGYPCLVTAEELQAAADQALGPGQVTVPDFNLGSGATAQLSHTIPPEVWSGFCDVLQSGDLPSAIEFPRCDEGFPVAIRVEVSFGERLIIGTRDVRLLYDAAAVANVNPVLTGAEAVDAATGTRLTLDDLGTADLRRDVTYELSLDLSEDQSETYQRDPRNGKPIETAREVLRLSWFHEGGELDAAATSFTDGSTTFDDASTNEWRTPRTDERAEAASRLFVVIRDDRGGTSWITAQVGLVQ